MKKLKTITELRRENLESLRNERQLNVSQFSKVLGVRHGQLYQLIGNLPRKAIGSVLARKFEKTLELPAGWLDQDRSKAVSRTAASLFGPDARDFLGSLPLDTLKTLNELVEQVYVERIKHKKRVSRRL